MPAAGTAKAGIFKTKNILPQRAQRAQRIIAFIGAMPYTVVTGGRSRLVCLTLRKRRNGLTPYSAPIPELSDVPPRAG